MRSLDEDVGQLISRLREPRGMSAGGGDPFYYIPYEPGDTFEVRRLLPAWEGRLRNAGYEPVRASFSRLLWELIDESGRWDLWLEIEREGDTDPEELNASIQSVLHDDERLIERVARVIGSAPPNGVVLLTDTEALHPFFRVRGLESRLHDRVTAPTVVFYPGRRVGQYGLRFLELYPEDSNYRATIIGGLP